MFCSREKKFISGKKAHVFGTPKLFYLWEENKNKVLRRKHSLVTFSRSTLFLWRKHMFCSREKKFISGKKAHVFGTPKLFYLWEENKNKVLRRKYVLAPFSRGNLVFIP